MGQRRDRLDGRLEWQKTTREKNSVQKTMEQDRREQRMITALKAGTLPYAPAVMSWLSAKLDKKATRITQDDIKTLVS